MRGYSVDIASPEGGPLRADVWSDPRDDSGYSAEDLISLGFVNSPAHVKLVEESKPLATVRVDDYDGALLVGGSDQLPKGARCSTTASFRSPTRWPTPATRIASP